MSDPSALYRLCALCGVQRSYRDAWEQERLVPDATLRAILIAMGFDAESDAGLDDEIRRMEQAAWHRMAPPVLIVTEGERPIVPVRVPRDGLASAIHWTLEQEEGETVRGEAAIGKLPLDGSIEFDGRVLERRAVRLPLAPPLGYHRLALRLGKPDQETADVRVIVAPPRCYSPAVLRGGGRLWGISVQLYAVTSARNWGMGDFRDLERLVEICHREGGSLVGLNPLHALFPGKPSHCSPYAPSSRLALNPLYLSVEAVPDFAECPEAQTLVNAPAFRNELAQLRSGRNVDYPSVAARKLAVLGLLYRAFRERHLDPVGADATGRGAEFRRFQSEGGSTLARIAAFEALAAHFGTDHVPDYEWRSWPDAFHDSLAEAVRAFARSHRERVEFHQYLQWQARQQLGRVASHCRTLGMPVGLYYDLAVGVDRHGADAWIQSEVLADGVSVGAPPDPLNLKGQNWGLPPWNPIALRNSSYQPFIEMLQANMRESSALRIDHILGLSRLFWIPRGAEPSDGGYVRYPLDDLLAIVALESQRNQCLVIGEDLGTLPDGLRQGLQEKEILSYRLFYFERDPAGLLRQPADYPRRALVSVGTHDLPTLAGFWRGDDLGYRRRLNLFPSKEVEAREAAARPRDRAAILHALRRSGLAVAGAPDPTVEGLDPPPSLIEGIHLYLARTPAMIMMVHLEDLIGELQPVNLPGTGYEYPNWQRKIAVSLEALENDPRITAICRLLNAERPGLGTG